MANQLTTVAVPDRRQRFRAFRKRFNPTAPAQAAIGDGLICQFPGRSIFKKLAAGADLAPGSQQLLVGGIGSGKTTELLMAEADVAAHDGTLAVYIDVSAETDLSALNSGALLASLGMRLSSIIKSRFQSPDDLEPIYQAIRKAAYGHEQQVWVPDDQYDEDDFSDDHELGHFQTIQYPGKLKPPFPALRRDIIDLTKSVSRLTEFLKGEGLELVAIFDGLDRLIKADKFWAVAEQDLRSLRPLDISVLAAGPLSIMYGQGRQIKDYFDEVHYLPPAVADPKASPFLFEVLHLRGADKLMSQDQMQRLCLASGGVLRDLISLASSAGVNAYLEDADHIGQQHVDRAIGQLGNSYLLGLGTIQTAIIRKLLSGGGFTPSDSESMELLITRRVLEQSESRYEVHPALAAVLPLAPDGAT